MIGLIYISYLLSWKKNTMKNTLKMIVLSFAFCSTTSFAADTEAGKEVYEEDCLSCHDSSVFTRPSTERKVNDLATLKKQVHRCVTVTEASWFEEDEENVAAYLNEAFYKFSTEKEVKEFK